MHSWDANEIFKTLPFYDSYIDKPKVYPFYDKLNIVKNKNAFSGYDQS